MINHLLDRTHGPTGTGASTVRAIKIQHAACWFPTTKPHLCL